MSKTKAKVASKRKLDRIMVVYGLGEDKKPRAAKFSEPEFELARKAAELMKLNVFEGESAKLRQVLQNLEPGRIYPKQPKVTRHRTAVALLDPTPPQSA